VTAWVLVGLVLVVMLGQTVIWVLEGEDSRRDILDRRDET
jgi:hypothetical protein